MDSPNSVNTRDIKDLCPILDSIYPSLSDEGQKIVGNNFQTLAKYFHQYTQTPTLNNADAVTDQLTLILAKSDGTECAVIQTAVLIVMEAHQAINSHLKGSYHKMNQYIDSAVEHYTRLK
jgi:hypothetical protein